MHRPADGRCSVSPQPLGFGRKVSASSTRTVGCHFSTALKSAAAVTFDVGRGRGTKAASSSSRVVFPHSGEGDVIARSGEIEAVSCRWAWSTHAATVSAPPAGKTRYREMVATRSSASASPSTASGHGSGSLRKVGVSSWSISVKNELLAQPFGLFSLLQTWSTTARSDYTLLRLLSDGRLLSAGRSRGGNWYLTPNGQNKQRDCRRCGRRGHEDVGVPADHHLL